MSLDLQALGFTQEELQTRVIDQIVERVLTGVYFDEDGDEVLRNSRFATELNKKIQDRIDTTISAIAEKHVLPNVTQYIEDLTIQETNQWGEKKGVKASFTEYLIGRAQAYMQEQVDHNGSDKSTSRDSYWSGKQTRITYLIHAHLHHHIETAMKDSMKTAMGEIAKGLHETTRLKLNEIAAGMKVAVTTK